LFQRLFDGGDVGLRLFHTRRIGRRDDVDRNDGGKQADDDDHDHQFDQSEAVFGGTFGGREAVFGGTSRRLEAMFAPCAVMLLPSQEHVALQRLQITHIHSFRPR
jgi:hypothetical protein